MIDNYGDYMVALNEVLFHHRHNMIIPCHDSCWCWNVDNAVIKMQKELDEAVKR